MYTDALDRLRSPPPGPSFTSKKSTGEPHHGRTITNWRSDNLQIEVQYHTNPADPGIFRASSHVGPLKSLSSRRSFSLRTLFFPLATGAHPPRSQRPPKGISCASSSPTTILPDSYSSRLTISGPALRPQWRTTRRSRKSEKVSSHSKAGHSGSKTLLQRRLVATP